MNLVPIDKEYLFSNCDVICKKYVLNKKGAKHVHYTFFLVTSYKKFTWLHTHAYYEVINVNQYNGRVYKHKIMCTELCNGKYYRLVY